MTPILRPEMLGVGGDGAQGLGGDLEQQVVDDGLVGVRDGADRCRQREHDVVVVDRQQVGLPRLQPPARRAPWHFGQCRLRQEL